jgi:hypothetical protein
MIISDFKVRRFEFPPIDHGIPDQHNGTIRS